MKKIALLYSGGVESSTLMASYLSKGYEVHPIFVRSGLEYEKREEQNAINLWKWFKKAHKGHLKSIHFIDVDWNFQRPKKRPTSRKEIVIPLRNLILIAHGSLYMRKKGIKKIVIGSQDFDAIPDANDEYFKSLEKLISQGIMTQIQIVAPFINKKKEIVIKKYSHLLPYSKTFSCVRDLDGLPCGKCIKCVEKNKALLNTTKAS